MDNQGLSPAEVAERTAQGKINRVRRSDAADYLDIVRRNFLTLFNAMVVPAAIALFALNEINGALAVSGMAATNSILGLLQEIRAKRQLERLSLLAEAKTHVFRGGKREEISSGDVVQGDLLALAAGDPVVADGPVLEARFLEVDEALLTGESDPVLRREGDQLLSGSFCVAGEGVYRADFVGSEAFAQKTSQEARTYRHTSSPLQASINRLIQALTGLAIGLCLSYVALYFLRDNFGPNELVKMIAATITSMVPQGLVLMATLGFLLGAVRMTARGALVQRLNAVESMASIDTLCMDKTGTLTTNYLKLDRIVLLGKSTEEQTVRHRLSLFSSLSLDRSGKSLTAIRTAVGESNGEVEDQLPFKSQNRYSGIRVRDKDKSYLLALGACEALKPFLGEDIRWEKTWKGLLPTGLRLMMFAEAVLPANDQKFQGSLNGFHLRPLALLALSDELRPEALEVLRGLADQGMSFKVLSGDNPETVRATVAALGQNATRPALQALASGSVISGAELEKAADPGKMIRDRAVFGRISPWQKVEIVHSLQAQGRRVAMIGDGVNDLLPLRSANLGIAMGDGSRATKTVAGIVLQTNDFGLLPETLEEGRAIVRNLRRAGKLFLTKNVFMVVLIVGALGIFKLPFPFEPQQVTLLNFLTIGAPALVITLSRGRSAPVRTNFVKELGWFALRTGLIQGAVGLIVVLLASRVWMEKQASQTLLLATMIGIGISSVFRVFADGATTPPNTKRAIFGIAAAAFPILAVAMYLRPAAAFFELIPLTLLQWGKVAGAIGTAILLILGFDRLAGRKVKVHQEGQMIGSAPG
jgi:cation-transporting ATPase E